MSKFRGFTLIELLATMAVASVLLTLSAGIIHRTMRFQSAAREELDAQRTAAQLAQQFRADGHQAKGLRVTDQDGRPPSVVFSLPSERGHDVTYTVTDQTMLREQRLDDARVRREQYGFRAGYHVTFAKLQQPQRAVLIVFRDLPGKGTRPREVLHVEVEVGRLLRLAAVQESSS